MKAKVLMFTAAVATLVLGACASTGEPVAQESKAEQSRELALRMAMDSERLRRREGAESAARHQRENDLRHSAQPSPQP